MPPSRQRQSPLFTSPRMEADKPAGSAVDGPSAAPAAGVAQDAVMTDADGPKPPVLGSVTVVEPQTIHDQHAPIAVDVTPRELPVLDQQMSKIVDGGDC